MFKVDIPKEPNPKESKPFLGPHIPPPPPGKLQNLNTPTRPQAQVKPMCPQLCSMSEVASGVENRQQRLSLLLGLRTVMSSCSGIGVYTIIP